MDICNCHITGAWLESHEPGERQFLKIGDLELESGEILKDITIAYQSWGKLNADKSNAILVNHALTGWSDVPGWWPSIVGPGLPLDTDQYFVICPNVIGGCQGSTGPASLAPDGKRWGSRFPTLTIRDMVQGELALTDALGIPYYNLAVGPSLGGMRALEWAVQYPDRVRAICSIGSSAVATGDQIGSASIQIRAIKSDPNYFGGDYYGKEIGPIAKPKEIRFGDNLPKTRSGKIMRRLLRVLAKGEEITQDTSTLENPAILDQLKHAI